MEKILQTIVMHTEQRRNYDKYKTIPVRAAMDFLHQGNDLRDQFRKVVEALPEKDRWKLGCGEAFKMHKPRSFYDTQEYEDKEGATKALNIYDEYCKIRYIREIIVAYDSLLEILSTIACT